MANKPTERITPFIEQILALRTAKGMSLREIAIQCDMPYGTLANYIYNGAVPPLLTIIKICNSFKMSPNSLLKGLYLETSEFSKLQAISSFINTSSKLNLVIDSMADGIPNLKNMNWGNKLHVLREDAGYSRADFADRCDISPGTIKLYETTQRFPSLFVFFSICRELGVSPAYMLCNELTFDLIDRPQLMALTPRQISALSATISYI